MTTPSHQYSRQIVFDYIIWYKQQHDGNSPTIRDIMNACRLSSSSHTLYILRKLQLAGKIKIETTAKARSITVIGGSWTYTA